MHESIDVHELIRDPAARRLWMLYKAATFLPLGDALELARAAEMFVSGSRSENRAASGDATQPHDAMQISRAISLRKARRVHRRAPRRLPIRRSPGRTGMSSGRISAIDCLRALPKGPRTRSWRSSSACPQSRFRGSGSAAPVRSPDDARTPGTPLKPSKRPRRPRLSTTSYGICGSRTMWWCCRRMEDILSMAASE